jgi:DNA polymerase-3 subunit delta'
MNWDMLGHAWAVDLLREHVSRGAQRHAYLFAGPEGIGRRTLALRLAQALNCPSPLAPGEPCRTCRTCRQIDQMQHPDLAVVQSEQAGATLKVDQIRELQRSLSLAPYEARYRVAILLRFEEANLNAANALLKTLEEPPPQVVFILTAESAERLPPTIVSRCEVLRLRPIPVEDVRQALQDRWGLDRLKAEFLAHLSAGRPGYALSLASQPEWLKKRHDWLEDHHRLLRATRVDRFSYAESLAKDKDNLRLFILTWLSLWRDVLVHASGAGARIENIDLQAEIAELASQLGRDRAYQTVRSLLRTLDLLDRNVNTRLAIDVLMLDLPCSSVK